MNEDCREMTLEEYIAVSDIDKNTKKRMLDLCAMTSKEIEQKDVYLHRCHMRIDELQETIVEISTELAKAKRFIREH